jgi:hypothetical protein
MTLHDLPGFVSGRLETFRGQLKGIVTSYDFKKNGKPWFGCDSTSEPTMKRFTYSAASPYSISKTRCP